MEIYVQQVVIDKQYAKVSLTKAVRYVYTYVYINTYVYTYVKGFYERKSFKGYIKLQ